MHLQTILILNIEDLYKSYPPAASYGLNAFYAFSVNYFKKESFGYLVAHQGTGVNFAHAIQNFLIAHPLQSGHSEGERLISSWTTSFKGPIYCH